MIESLDRATNLAPQFISALKLEVKTDAEAEKERAAEQRKATQEKMQDEFEQVKSGVSSRCLQSKPISRSYQFCNQLSAIIIVIFMALDLFQPLN